MSHYTAETIRTEITSINNSHISKLKNKLRSLCNNSTWKEVGRSNLIHNISNTELKPVEYEALQFGLKFATGLNKHNLTRLININYRHSDSDFQKGFVQGLITASTTCDNDDPVLPQRYITALKSLSNNQEILITSSDKGGGIVIMNSSQYNDKMLELLSDQNTYDQISLHTITQNTNSFNKSYKNLVKHANKSWSSIIEYHPTIPTIYGLPKTHKPGFPLRPIISGIGTAPHNIAKSLAKLLTPLLGTISNSHIKNSNDLINKIKNINMQNKLLSSLDIKSLYTNIPVNKCITRLENHLKKSNISLPLPTQTIIKICKLCTQNCFFQYNGIFYKQKFGLPMGSPLSGVLACLYLEFLESKPFKYILPADSNYFRYIDDILFIYPLNHNITQIVERLNKIEPTINFTHELEHKHTLPFLDILLTNNNNHLEFKVYHKPTNKNDHIHFYSHHNTKIKSGLVIGFYLRALRICTKKFLDEEFEFIDNSFTQLQYPQSFIQRARKKAIKIHNRKHLPSIQTNNTPTNNYINRYIILPNNSATTIIEKNLNNLGIKTVSNSSKTIKSIINNKRNNTQTRSNAGVYTIQCLDCNKQYIGETSRHIDQRIREHKRDIRNGQMNNALTKHISETNHSFNFKESKLLVRIHNKNERKIVESSTISIFNTIKQRPGFFLLSPYLSKIVLMNYKIPYT